VESFVHKEMPLSFNLIEVSSTASRFGNFVEFLHAASLLHLLRILLRKSAAVVVKKIME
jgi:hypothetical protein